MASKLALYRSKALCQFALGLQFCLNVGDRSVWDSERGVSGVGGVSVGGIPRVA